MNLAEQIEETDVKVRPSSSLNEALAFALLKYSYDHRGEGGKNPSKRPWFNFPLKQAMIALEMVEAIPRGLWGYDLVASGLP